MALQTALSSVAPAPPLQFVGVPGGPELLVILLVLLFVFGVPLLLAAAAAVWLYRRRDDEDLDERVRELEGQIAELRRQLDEK